MSLVLLVALASIAATTRQPSPPTIAEFAPQAVEQITDATDGESSSGASPGSRLDDDLPRTGEAARDATAVEVARVRRCVGDPPRQIEDPQAPPCVPYWSGDNGGSTYKGVTRDEIRVAIPEWYADVHPRLETFFNSRFELYGRRVRFLENARFISLDPAQQRTGAVRADEELRVFASSQYPLTGGHYNLELVKRGVVSVDNLHPFPESELARHRPYLWMYETAGDRLLSSVGEWYCNQLAGGAADHAGVGVQGARRRLGVIREYPAMAPSMAPAPLRSELQRCGESLAEREFVFTGDAAQDVQNARNIIVDMQARGVTTLLCLCNVFRFGQYMHPPATQQAYFPEWVATTWGFNDINAFARAVWRPEHAEHSIGVSFFPKHVRTGQMPVIWALEEAGWQQSAGTATAEDLGRLYYWTQEYKSLLLLVSGMQMAGPNLTPLAFEQGLHRTRFPNPEHPTLPGKVGFGDGDHSMIDDAAQMWWSSSDRDPWDGRNGVWCYVSGGARFTRGTWPHGPSDRFRPPCDAGG